MGSIFFAIRQYIKVQNDYSLIVFDSWVFEESRSFEANESAAEDKYYIDK